MPTYHARLVTSATCADEIFTFKTPMRMNPRNQLNLIATFDVSHLSGGEGFLGLPLPPQRSLSHLSGGEGQSRRRP